FEGHVCIKPFSWWREHLKARGFELLPEPRELLPDEQGTYGLKAFDGVHEDMSEQLVFFRWTKPSPADRPATIAVRRETPRIRRPRVSIGVVCCDRAGYLRTTLASTRASLQNFSERVEWLAYDNGSGPEIGRLLEAAELSVVLRSKKNRGLAPAMD